MGDELSLIPVHKNVSGIKIRITAVMLFCLLVGGALLSRAAFIQLGRHDRLENMAKRQFQSKLLIRPRRGLILDRNGEPLAANTENNSLAANPSKIRNKRTLARLLAKALDIPASKLLARLGEPKEFAWIKRHLTEGEITRLKRWKIINSDGDLADGLWLIKESQRVYPHGELAGHTIGSVNIDSEGLEGVELWMNERMRGKVVSMSAIKDALGRPAFIDAMAAKNFNEAKDGESIALTLDASLQFEAEEQLKNTVRKAGAKGGTVIVMNAVNGEILALANQPTYNPNMKGSSLDHRRNRALTDGYEPGSTMKPILLASALSHGFKLTDEIYGEQGQFKVQGKKISEAEAHEKFKWINLKKMIQVSSNVGAAKLALKLGADAYSASLRMFGFGSKTGIGFPGEISGRVPQRKAWQPLTLANIGFGQGILVTPLQMLRSYAVFLNGGWLVQPTLLKSPTTIFEGELPKRILSQKVSDQVLEALQAVTAEGGTGGKATLMGYQVAGKTGTAQKVDPATGGYSRSKYVSSFIGFAVNVKPKIVIFVSVDEPRGAYYASEVAAPLFRDVLGAVANRLSLPTQGSTPRVLAANKSEPFASGVFPPVIEPADTPIEAGVTGTPDSLEFHQSSAMQMNPETPKLKWYGADSGDRFLWKMPQLRGLTPREVIQTLKGHHFQLDMRGVGLVFKQSPEEGKILADGDTVRLTLVDF